MKSSKSSLFLLELIIAILFFSISAAACIQLFAKAHTVDIRTGEQNQTIIWSQNLAELWRTGHGDLSLVEKQIKEDYFFPEGSVLSTAYQDSASSTATLQFFFDKNWNFTPGTPAYSITLETNVVPDADGLLNATICFFRADESDTPFYKLPLQLHIADKGVRDHE